MDKKTLIAVLLSLAIWVAWQKLYWDPYQRERDAWEQQVKNTQKEQSVTSDNLKKGKTKPNIEKIVSAINSQISHKKIAPTKKNVSFNNAHIEISNRSELFQNWELTDFSINQGEIVNLEYVTGFHQQVKFSVPGEDFIGLQNENWKIIPTKSALYRDKLETSSIKLERVISKGETPYTVNLNYNIEFKKIIPSHVFISLYGRKNRKNDEPGGLLSGYPDLLEVSYLNLEGKESFQAKALKEDISTKDGAKWLGINTKYFLLALIPKEEKLRREYGVKINRINFHKTAAVKGSLLVPTNGKKQFSIPVVVFFGPKQLEYLESIETTLPQAIDFGWTSVLAVPLLKTLKWFYAYTGNYGVSIIFLTILIKILLFPITYKGMKSMAALPKLRPQMEKIQAKYKDDKQKLQQEMLNLYRVNKVNPIGGCFSIILQMPIFFALFRLLFNCVELYQSPFIFWIQDLSAKDPYYVLPVLLIVFMYLQQTITPMTTTDPNQKRIMQLIPVIFGVFMLFLPAGLNIYTLVNVIFSAGQQYFLNKKLNIHNSSS